MNIIEFTVSLNNVKMGKRHHAVRHAINWVNSLDTGKYSKYERFPDFRAMYFDGDGHSLVSPFSAYVITGSNWATVYIEAENPTNIYDLFLFYWRNLNHRKISPCKPCLVVPTQFSSKVGKVGQLTSVMKFSLDLQSIEYERWNKDIKKAARWLYRKKVRHILDGSNDKYFLFGVNINIAQDFSFAYTINEKYKRATVFIRSNQSRKDVETFKQLWCRRLKYHKPFAIVDWGRIPSDVGHYVLKNGKAV